MTDLAVDISNVSKRFQEHVAVRDLNLRVLNGVSPDFFSTGTAEVAVRINGSFGDPRVIGTASINNGSVSVLLGNERWTVANLRAAVRFTANQAQIDALEGSLGGGRISATGGALLEGFTVSAFRVNLRGTNVTDELGLTEANSRIFGTAAGTGGVILARPLEGSEINFQAKYRW